MIKNDMQCDDLLPLNRAFPLVDIFKFISALLVVLIHSAGSRQQYPIANSIVDIFAGQAVPFFMIVSGFFIGGKLKKSNLEGNILYDYSKRMICLYAVWEILLFPKCILCYMELYPDASPFYITLLLLRRYLFAGYDVYWYLLAMGEAAIVLLLFVKFKKIKLFYFTSLIGLLLGYAYDLKIGFCGYDQVNQLFYTLFSWSNNVLMKGLPYFAIGYYVSKHLEKVFLLRLRTYLVLYIAVNILSVVFYSGEKDYMYCVCTIQAILLFVIAIRGNLTNIPKKLANECRNMSSCIYFVHTIIISNIVDVWFMTFPALCRFLIPVIGSIIIYLFARTVNLNPLNWLLCIKGAKHK